MWVYFFRQKNTCKGCAWLFTARGWVFFVGVLLAAINPPGRQAARGSDPPRKMRSPPCLPFPSLEAGAPSLVRSVKKAVFSPSRESFFFEYLSHPLVFAPLHIVPGGLLPPLAKGSYIPRNSFHEISFRGLGASGSRGFHKYIFHGQKQITF